MRDIIFIILPEIYRDKFCHALIEDNTKQKHKMLLDSPNRAGHCQCHWPSIYTPITGPVHIHLLVSITDFVHQLLVVWT